MIMITYNMMLNSNHVTSVGVTFFVVDFFHHTEYKSGDFDYISLDIRRCDNFCCFSFY